jgi:hypothetical protein
MNDDELLMTAASRVDLVPEAAHALDSEMARRQLSYQEAHAKKREVARLEIKEATRHRSSRKRSKYFVAKANGWMLLLLAVGAPLFVLVLMVFHIVPEEWLFPILSVCMGALIAVAAVQPWLRQTSSFWISLIVSCTVQLLVGYWLSVHLAPQTRGELKGVGVLTILPGYAVGILSFLLLQKLEAGKGSQPNSP